MGAMLAATPALARDGAWYVGGEFGAMIVEDVGFDFGAGPTLPDRDAQVAFDHDYGFDGALFVGYDLGAFRLEAEVAYKRARVDDIETIFAFPPPAGPSPVGEFSAGGGSTSALSFMINGMLDFGDDDGISGFVGGGAGVARVNYNNVRAFESRDPYIDDHDSKFAWQLFAGVRQAISDNVDVTVRYRFFNVNKLEVLDIGGFPGRSSFSSHSVLGGITFNFGGPPPPPPAAPVSTAPPPPAYAPPPPAEAVSTGPFIVFFDWDRDEITPQAAAVLDQVAADYQRSGQARVTLAGHADRSGPADYNVGLAQRRADNARSYLAGRGVPDAVMTTQSFGESEPRVPTADGVREVQNRRVEVNFGPGSGW